MPSDDSEPRLSLLYLDPEKKADKKSLKKSTVPADFGAEGGSTIDNMDTIFQDIDRYKVVMVVVIIILFLNILFIYFC